MDERYFSGFLFYKLYIHMYRYAVDCRTLFFLVGKTPTFPNGKPRLIG